MLQNQLVGAGMDVKVGIDAPSQPRSWLTQLTCRIALNAFDASLPNTNLRDERSPKYRNQIEARIWFTNAGSFPSECLIGSSGERPLLWRRPLDFGVYYSNPGVSKSRQSVLLRQQLPTSSNRISSPAYEGRMPRTSVNVNTHKRKRRSGGRSQVGDALDSARHHKWHDGCG